MLEFGPNLITISIDFRYETDKKVRESDSQVSNKGVPNEIRRAFLGLKRGAPNIPKKIQERMDSKDPVLFPVQFSIIKKPIMISGRLRNAGVGAMILYEYLGSYKDLEKLLDILDKFLGEEVFSDEFNEKGKGKYSYSLSVSDYRIIVGKDWEEIKK